MKDSPLMDGEAKYNSSLDILARINGWIRAAGNARQIPGLSGLSIWLNYLHTIETELYPYMNPEEIEILRAARVPRVPVENDGVSNKRHAANAYRIYYERLDAYQKVLLQLHAKKGMGIIGKDKNEVFIISGG